jgi:tetratricopeptide (TPR) repeat protein
LPIAADIAVRVNLVSVVSSAFAALFAYLVLIRIIRGWFSHPQEIYNRIITYVGGVTGALFLAFSSTHWANSVEAEVYASTMALMLLIYWLALRFIENQSTLKSVRVMLLALYLSVLGIGIHLTLYIIIPVVGLYFILRKGTTNREWVLVAVYFLFELYLIFALSSRPDEIPYYLPVLILFIFFVFQTLLRTILTMPIKITALLYLVTLYPLYFLIWDNISQNLGGGGLSSTIETLQDIPIGWVGLAALVMWGLYCLSRMLMEGGRSYLDSSWFQQAAYALVPGILIALGEIFNNFDGYNSFKILTVLATLLVLWYLRHRVNWVMLAAVIGISLIMLGFWQFIYGLLAAIPAIIILAAILKNRGWRVALSVILLGIIGYSVHVYIPIRSAHNPAIDENNPSQSLDATVGYLERKQYGAESMVSRMFERRGEWENQFGDYRRMGFWRFFKEQYGFTGALFFVPLILGLFGLWEAIRRKPKVGLPFLLLLMMCTVGIVLYMNFADGMRQNPLTGGDYLEVRNRDYFFTAGFIVFGMAIGLGIAALMALLRDSVAKYNLNVRKIVMGAGTLLVLLPIVPLSTNYFINDRSRNYMPYDYAYNLLHACEENAVLITNGDNDTFPVWCIQETYGFRKDVGVVVLALANADWYIKQVRDYHNVPLRWSDEQIDRLRPYRLSDGTVKRLQDMVIDEIIDGNNWEQPLHMSVTTPSKNRIYKGKPLDDNLILEGMVYRIVDSTGFNRINVEKTVRMFEQDYKFRGTADTTIYKDEATRRLVNNYAQGFMWLADTARNANDYQGAFEHIRKGLEVLPQSEELYGYGAQLLAIMGRLDTLEAYIASARVDNKERIYMQWALTARHENNMDDAIHVLELLYREYPDFEDGFRSLAATYYRVGQYDKLRATLADWVSRHPEDVETRQILREMEKLETIPDTGGAGG